MINYNFLGKILPVWLNFSHTENHFSQAWENIKWLRSTKLPHFKTIFYSVLPSYSFLFVRTKNKGKSKVNNF